MILTAHQPLYLPWLGLIHKVALSDKFCILDGVQFADRDFIHRNKILNTNNEPRWITIPVYKKNHRSIKIRDTKVLGTEWVDIHLQAMVSAYRQHEYFLDYYPEIELILKKVKSSYLIDFTVPLAVFILRQFECFPEISFQSDFVIDYQKSDLILELSRLHSATKYFSGAQGINYLDVNTFRSTGIEIEFQDFRPLPYKQRTTSFHAGLSAIDLLFNAGPDSRMQLFRGNIDLI